jgi:aldose sugar dehydrogenase
MTNLYKILSITIAGFLLVPVVVPAQDTSGDAGNDSEFAPRIFPTQYHRIQLEKVAGPFENPWSVAFLPDGRMLVTERPGRLNIVHGSEITPVTGTPDVHAQNQGGLMEVAVHPGYEENGWIYLTWSKPDGDDETATALVRGRLDGTSFTDMQELFVQDRYSSPGRHYGSKLAWTPEGHLLMSIGDRGADPPRAQDIADHAGTLLRLNDDGTPAEGNPFAGRDDALPEIYTYGHRNIQGLVVNPETGDIWSTEHGPRGGDELNIHYAGANYGWPVATLGLDYRSQEDFPHSETRYGADRGMADPFYEFLPTHGAGRPGPGHLRPISALERQSAGRWTSQRAHPPGRIR